MDGKKMVIAEICPKCLKEGKTSIMEENSEIKFHSKSLIRIELFQCPICKYVDLKETTISDY
jgi:hypothetical protein